MKEIIRINLDNEMDLILAHKRAMKLAELCGLIVSSQTRFATSVSEIARCSISSGENSHLILGINFLAGGKKEVSAIVYDGVDLAKCNPEAYAYAGRLSKNIGTTFNNGVYEITLALPVPSPGIITDARITSFTEFFKREAPLSPYDEIRKKNIQLIELSEKLSESESSYRQLTDTLPLIVFSVTNSGAITLANKKLIGLFGTNFNHFSANAIAAIFHEKDSPAVIKGWATAQKRKTHFAGQGRVKTPEGYIWYLVSIVPNKDEKGEVFGWIVSMVDIHAQKLVEETLKDNKELREAQRRLKDFNEELSAKNRELEQFAYIASHDLQEPLRKIRNFTSLAERNLTEEERDKLYFNKINASADRMSRLIKDVLNYSKLSIKTDAFTNFSLKEVMDDVISDFEFLIQEKGAAITVEGLPVVKGIPIQLSQLFYNLVGNSLKFSVNKPVVSVTCEAVASGEGNKYYKISVADNGIGIEEQHIEKIFTIFKRLHAQNEYEGTGIGLALCKKIAENHGGYVDIHSIPEKGTVIDVYLPM